MVFGKKNFQKIKNIEVVPKLQLLEQALFPKLQPPGRSPNGG
jgi:hypothetical protein